jgi:non-heme chloroperoxidase
MHANDVQLKVTDEGEGRPVVLIHGWPLSGEAFTPQIPALTAAGYRVITYDRRGFGSSDKPESGYDYDTLAADLEGVLSDLELRDVTLLGFSMGGGEVARYAANHGEDRLHSVVFASAVPPYLMKTEDNPEGPLTEDKAGKMENNLKKDRDVFFEQFTRDFFTANGDLKVSEAQRQEALKLCKKSDQKAALACMAAFGTTDFRDDLAEITVPALILHGDADGIVPYEGSGDRTRQRVANGESVVIKGAPHGCNVSHAEEFNEALLRFLQK